MQIAFHTDSTIKAEGWSDTIFPDANGCISIAVTHSMRHPWGDTVYSHGELSLHGTKDSIRAFGQAIVDAANGKSSRIEQFPPVATDDDIRHDPPVVNGVLAVKASEVSNA